MEMHDSLTGLYNKWGFFFKVQELLKEDTDTNYQILCSNIRHFKLINDLFGFLAGDKIIKSIADSLKRNSVEKAVYARLEGDKFVVYVPTQYARKVMDLFLDTNFHIEESSRYVIHIDLGIYEIDDRSIPVSLMCDRANMALQTIKEDRNQHVAYFKETMREQMVKEQMLYSDLHRALRENEMTIYLQGIFNSEEKVIGAEALVRWIHPTKGVLPAGLFVETLEKNGLIISLDKYIWELACIQLQKWKNSRYDELFLAINVSSKDFEAMDVCNVLVGLTSKYQISPDKLRIEITETALMHDVERNLSVIEELRNHGFMVEIDDFGSGYSSLNTLKDIIVDVVKLDMKFLQVCKNEERSRVILQSMVELVKKLEMQVIVEGVETKEQLELLNQFQCDAFQGYYLMRPTNIENFEELVIQNQTVA